MNPRQPGILRAKAIFLLALAGCLPARTLESRTPPQPTAIGPTPSQAGVLVAPTAASDCTYRSTILGRLFSFYLNQPVPETAFYLSPVERAEDETAFFIGPRPDRGDIQGVSDGVAAIRLSCVPEGDYYLVVWAPYSWAPAVQSPNDQRLRVISVPAEGSVDLGTLYLAWP